MVIKQAWVRHVAASAALWMLLVPSIASAQTGISESDVVQREGEQEEGKDFLEDNPARNITDAIRDRPTSVGSITRPKISGELLSDEERVEREGNFRTRVGVLSRFVGSDNLDFRPLNDESPLAIRQSDDRVPYGATMLRAGATLDVVDNASIDMGFAHNGLWGGDTLGDIRDSNMIFIDTAFLNLIPVDIPGLMISTRIGRQYFQIGGTFGAKDFLFWDVIDGASLNVDLYKAGRITGIFDVVGVQMRPDEQSFQRLRDDPDVRLNFRGSNNTYRYGARYENTQLVKNLGIRAFGFFADIGAAPNAGGTGSNISYNGNFASYVDNDYVWMAGGRVNYGQDIGDALTFDVFGEFAQSGGIDRRDRSVGFADIATSGSAFGGGARGAFETGALVFSLGGQYFRADGPNYASGRNDLAGGVPFNHGFVGFKGAHAGGFILDDVAGFHPSAYVGSAMGVTNNPQEQTRIAGTQVISANVGVEIAKQLKIQGDFAFLTDTGTPGVTDPNEIDASADRLPFGMSPAMVEAQLRHGTTIGTELGLGLTWSPNKNKYLTVFAQGGIFIPGEYYSIEIENTAGTALGFPDPMNTVAAAGGVSMFWE